MLSFNEALTFLPVIIPITILGIMVLLAGLYSFIVEHEGMAIVYILIGACILISSCVIIASTSIEYTIISPCKISGIYLSDSLDNIYYISEDLGLKVRLNDYQNVTIKHDLQKYPQIIDIVGTACSKPITFSSTCPS